ncbi:septum formation family protein [Corynebacterium sp. Marseille-P4321]|uniref:septum formation family protein n=1 Tax=Corynebacterium sp. Marseille-P4321 TaxID=2736603 RepID=UPI00158ACD53|nr:septum formation family protein [Corynebacterium sp. Marseille-P4321]
MASLNSAPAALRAFLIAALAGSVATGAYAVATGPNEGGTGAASPTPSSDPQEAVTFTTADAGSCLTWQVAEDGTISNFEQADCAGEHRFEVSLREDLATYPTSEFGPEAELPNQTRQAQLREELCGAATLRYLDGRYDPNGRYSIAPILPPADAWERGDRTMLCGLQETNRAGEPVLTTGRVAEQDQARLFEPGQCVSIDGANSLAAVPCADPHQLEITSQVNLAEAFPDHTPSVEEQDKFLGDRCTKDAHDYLGGEENLYQIALRPFWTTQPAAAWEGGSRSVNCSLMFSRPQGEFANLQHSAKEGRGQLLIDGNPPPERPERRPLRSELPTPQPTDPAALNEPNPAAEMGVVDPNQVPAPGVVDPNQVPVY